MLRTARLGKASPAGPSLGCRSFQLDAVLHDYQADAAEDVGPGRMLMEGESPDTARRRLQAALAGFRGPPFTVQRLAELLLEPRRQYSQLHKLVGPPAAAGHAPRPVRPWNRRCRRSLPWTRRST